MRPTPTLLFVSLLAFACKPARQSAATDTLSVAGAPVAGARMLTPLHTVRVRNSTELQAALLAARPGDDIVLADGVYNGRFTIPGDRNGRREQPVTLRGSRAAILDGGSVTTGYVLRLQANHWIIRGLTIRNGLKGIMADDTHYSTIDSVAVDRIGEEAIHLRRNSTHNVVRRCLITNTGLHTAGYGEGVYIGSAVSNWPTYTNGSPDRSDSNQVLDNEIGPGIAAECIDIKEGTTGGIVRGNRFNSEGITGANYADSWIDVKGNGWRIEHNEGVNPAGSVLVDGFQVNVAAPGWGNDNEFRGNRCTVNGRGYGVLVRLQSKEGKATGNKVWADNRVTGAALGVSNIPLTQ
ncbi:MAG: coagulation factor 5/8 type domain-containing protein [Chitinophagaceae bacterium]|nr:MAG: coagulation factor 5/8 type domain-containing protein [Chitinophagaceae bacterium]